MFYNNILITAVFINIQNSKITSMYVIETGKYLPQCMSLLQSILSTVYIGLQDYTTTRL